MTLGEAILASSSLTSGRVADLMLNPSGGDGKADYVASFSKEKDSEVIDGSVTELFFDTVGQEFNFGTEIQVDFETDLNISFEVE